MPDEAGKLTAAEKQLVSDWIGKKAGPDLNCPVCGDSNWIIGDHLVQPITIGDKLTLMLGGIGYPQVMLISQNCGHTLFINAVIIGLVKPTHSEGTPLG
jgi:hypothetical protein